MIDLNDWNSRINAELAVRNLTRTSKDICLTLPSFAGPYGIMPSQETIAAAVGCCVDSVRVAMKDAARLGLVYVVERWRRIGWRRVRDTNRYILNVPQVPVTPGLRPVRRRPPTTPEKPGVQSKEEKKEALQGMIREAAGAGDLLKQRREAVERAMIAKMRARYPAQGIPT